MRLVLGLSIFAITVCYAAVQQDTITPPDPATELLREAYSIGMNFPPQERADLLMTLAYAAVGINRELVAPWSVELFYFADKNLPPDNNRAAIKKNALTALAQVDPNRAADLFTQLDLPPRPLASEDVRSFAARTIFAKLWEADGGIKSLEKIERLANWLGETGQYPYSAMAGIILKTAEKDQEKAADLFAEAQGFLQRDPGFPVTNKQFVEDFLLRTWKIPDKGILASAIASALASIERAEKSNHTSAKVEIFASQGKVALHSEGDYLVYRLLPLVQALDAKWADQLRDKYKEAASAPNDSLDSPSPAAVAVSPDGSASDAAMRNALDRGTVARVSQLAASDPKRALQLALSISDPSERSIALASVFPTYAKIDAAGSDTGLEALSKQLDSMDSGIGKLQVMTALIEADFALKKNKDAVAMIGRAFDLGSELVARDLEANPGEMLYLAPGVDELTRITEDTAKRPSVKFDILQKVRRASPDLLRARLLVAAARGIAAAPKPVDGEPN
ncbi:MAG TPA: hypothetical protein VKX39_09535 [Bryobacteraceae bacterium]|jgi:hypothetical protein|nr:hypothetical protein [Bryobacteraceae bacterium]